MKRLERLFWMWMLLTLGAAASLLWTLVTGGPWYAGLGFTVAVCTGVLSTATTTGRLIRAAIESGEQERDRSGDGWWM